MTTTEGFIDVSSFSPSVSVGASPPSVFDIGDNAPLTSPISEDIAPAQPKYQIVDLFWLINPLILQGKPRPQNMADVVIISYNVQFMNLRLSMYSINNALVKNMLYLSKMQRLISGTIYPEYAYQIIHTSTEPIDNEKGAHTIVTVERMFQDTGASWQQNRPVTKVMVTNGAARVIAQDQNTGAYYDFTGWQFNVFIDSCKFCISDGFRLAALSRQS